MAFNVPARNNHKLARVLERIQSDLELQQLWKCANINAVDRSGISDHGEIHIRIVANAALKIMRLLMDGRCHAQHRAAPCHGQRGCRSGGGDGRCLHDTGISVHRDDHEKYSLFIANYKARELLAGIYEQPQLTIMVSEILHAIIAHDADQRCLTIEAGALKVADTTDMTEGRSRIPFQAGQLNIHSISALAVKDVKIEKGEDRPVRIAVTLPTRPGIFQLDNLLKHKLKNSTLVPYVEVVAQMEEGTTEKRLFEVWKL
jgi:metal-dependent HD superfamily phosphatase/phosphodiesterase